VWVFAGSFDLVFRAEGLRVIRTPVRAPRANAFAERWVGTLRRGCLNWILIVHHRQPEALLRESVTHDNAHRPHRALGLRAPAPRLSPLPTTRASPRPVERHDRLGGLIHEYDLAA
jgi:transposase InsO family protein